MSVNISRLTSFFRLNLVFVSKPKESFVLISKGTPNEIVELWSLRTLMRLKFSTAVFVKAPFPDISPSLSSLPYAFA